MKISYIQWEKKSPGESGKNKSGETVEERAPPSRLQEGESTSNSLKNFIEWHGYCNHNKHVDKFKFHFLYTTVMKGNHQLII